MTARTCRATACPNRAEPGLGWCPAHQLSDWERVDADLRERFAARMVAGIMTNTAGCWLYAGPRNPVTGYAVAEHVGRRTSVHRWMFWYLKDGLKPDHELHHVCSGAGGQDTRHCIRPAHLVQILPGHHREVTRLRAEILAAAEPGSRFYQVDPGETGASVEFARMYDLPRHEVDRLAAPASADGGLAAHWHLVIPERFRQLG